MTHCWYENDGNANPSWTAVDIATFADGAYDIHVADIDGDGDLDIVSASAYDDTIARMKMMGMLTHHGLLVISIHMLMVHTIFMSLIWMATET